MGTEGSKNYFLLMAFVGVALTSEALLIEGCCTLYSLLPTTGGEVLEDNGHDGDRNENDSTNHTLLRYLVSDENGNKTPLQELSSAKKQGH